MNSGKSSILTFNPQSSNLYWRGSCEFMQQLKVSMNLCCNSCTETVAEEIRGMPGE